MAQFGDAIVSYPVSGSSSGSAGAPPAVFLRTVSQCVSASSFYAFHPGGAQTTAIQIAPRNNNRVRMSIINSGTLQLLLDHGASFNPNTAPVATIPGYDHVVAANLGMYLDDLPVYTGPIFVGWIGSGSISGSCAIMTEYTG